MAASDDPTGDDMYLAPELVDETAGRQARDPRTNIRIETDLAAGHLLDPLDMLDRPTVQNLWGQEGRRLLAREDQVAAVAQENAWTFAALDARLSAHLVEDDITDNGPRITRHVCTPVADGATVTDLTGVIFDRDGSRPDHLRLQVATAGLVGFPSNDRIAIVPRGAADLGWSRFGSGLATESAEFDEKYRVHCQNPSWAEIVLNPAQLGRLIDHWPLTVVITKALLAVIKPGWVSAATLPDFRRFTEQVARSAQAARSDQTTRLRPPAIPTARLSGWSAWPPPPD
jgi:hypothetical protein